MMHQKANDDERAAHAGEIGTKRLRLKFRRGLLYQHKKLSLIKAIPCFLNVSDDERVSIDMIGNSGQIMSAMRASRRER